MQVAMLNPAEMPILKGSRIAYVGVTSEGFKIRMIFEKTGKLVTAFPLFE